MVLLHGASLGSSADVYALALPLLAAGGIRAIAYDQPGYGESDPPPEFSEEYRCRFLLDLLDALGLTRVHLLAHSRTGEWTARAVLDHPERAGMVVMAATLTMLPPRSAGAGPRRSSGSAVVAPATPADTRAALAPDVHDIDSVAEAYVLRRHRYSVGRAHEMWSAYARAAAPLTQGTRQPLWHEFSRAPVPKLYLVGSEDRSSAAERAATLGSEGGDHLQVRMLDGCRHLLMLDAPDRFAAAVVAFLSPGGDASGPPRPQRSGA